MSEKTFRSVHRGATISPRKARYVLDMIRGKPVTEALDILRFSSKRAAPMLSKVVMSALATAQLDAGVDHNRLHIVDVRADDGPRMKRYTPRARGQMFPLITRFAHLTVVLAERERKAGRHAGKTADRGRRARVEASRRAEGAAGQAETGGAGKPSASGAGAQENA
jgi:large subunit ribosomal protein L22